MIIYSFKDGVKISDSSDHFQVVRDQADKGFYELIIPVVKKQDAGLYKCVAINKFGESSCEATVTITGTVINTFFPFQLFLVFTRVLGRTYLPCLSLRSLSVDLDFFLQLRNISLSLFRIVSVFPRYHSRVQCRLIGRKAIKLICCIGSYFELATATHLQTYAGENSTKPAARDVCSF